MTAELCSAVVGSAVAERVFGAITREDLRRYAEASGDRNPLHLDPAFARQAGFDDVIVHGMLGMAVLGRLVTESFPGRRLRAFRARFRNIIRVDHPIRCTARLESRGEALAVLTLIATDEAGAVLIEGTASVPLVADD